MTQRQQLSRRLSGRRARSGTPGAAVRHRDTLPGMPRVVEPPSEPTLLGLPAEFEQDPVPAADGAVPDGPSGWAEDDGAVLVLRRSDAVAGSLLLIGGAAGAMSLFLPWMRHDGALGISLVRAAADLAGSGIRPLVSSGLALPLGVAVGGGVLFLLGLLAFRPARTHRATGTGALAVALAVASGVVVRVSDAGWAAVAADPGTVCAILLAALGALGALKAMLTAPLVVAEPG